MVVILGILWLVLNRTALGQATQATGGNVVAARLSGIRVDRVKIIAFTIAGICAAMTGILLASQLQAGELGSGDGYLSTLSRRASLVRRYFATVSSTSSARW